MSLEKKMLSYEEYTKLIHLLNSNLSAFLSVKEAMLSCGISPFNFNESTEKIKSIGVAAKGINKELYKDINQSEGNYSINTAITFIDHLLESISCLGDISLKLGEKANGGKYGFFAYRKDLKNFNRIEENRESMGSQLNSSINRPW